MTKIAEMGVLEKSFDYDNERRISCHLRYLARLRDPTHNSHLPVLCGQVRFRPHGLLPCDNILSDPDVLQTISAGVLSSDRLIGQS